MSVRCLYVSSAAESAVLLRGFKSRTRTQFMDHCAKSHYATSVTACARFASKNVEVMMEKEKRTYWARILTNLARSLVTLMTVATQTTGQSTISISLSLSVRCKHTIDYVFIQTTITIQISLTHTIIRTCNNRTRRLCRPL